MRRSSLHKAKSKIARYFSESLQRVFKRSEISSIFQHHQTEWKIAVSTSLQRCLSFLKEERILVEVNVDTHQSIEVRLCGEGFSPLELAQSLKKRAYLTHFTAMYLHSITDSVPKRIYVNYEQQDKPRSNTKLQQDRIDWAFARDIRRGKNIVEFGNHSIYLINGMYTGRAGVITLDGPNEEPLATTSVERTLIDITVRPEYSGGVNEVLKAYELAHEIVSVNALVALLKRINYVYPYHQAIGFYLDKSGVYSNSQIDLLSEFNMEYDFYLAHKMKETDYSDRWRLFVPNGFK